jgi:hypothetical protein
MRRKYVWDAESRSMVEVTHTGPKSRQHFIQADIQPFVSPVDGTVIKSRQHMRKYMKANNLAHMDDFSGSMEKRIAEREKFYQGRDRKSVQQRVDTLRDSYEHVRNQERARRQYG